MNKPTQTFMAFLFTTVFLLSGCGSTPSEKPNVFKTTDASAPTDNSRLNSVEQIQYKNAIKFLESGDTKKAEDILETLSKAKPDFAGSWANLAIIQYNNDNLERAKELAEFTQKLNPNSAQMSNLLGKIDCDQGKFKEAERHYSTAIAINDDYAIAHFNLALLYDIYFQQIDLAAVHYRRYLELTDFQDKLTTEWLQQLERTISTK